MITVIYHKKYNALTMEGHAYSGEPGHDLVCSAASMLANTLAANVAVLEDGGQVRDMHTELEHGKADVRCTPVGRYRAVVTVIFDAVCAGFALLARDYPENITYEVME